VATEVAEHLRLAARNRCRGVDTPAGTVNALPPPMTNDWNVSMGAVPVLGQHTEDVLA
jgi:crotonobetainyl-CoA:carnitine CoA-transferase CaiB-like acyl-CoA transferase